MWIVAPLEIADSKGKGTGRWRLTATSDEGGGGPFGDESHDHPSAREAERCERCDSFCAGVAGMPSRAALARAEETRDRAEYERLHAKYGAR